MVPADIGLGPSSRSSLLQAGRPGTDVKGREEDAQDGWSGTFKCSMTSSLLPFVLSMYSRPVLIIPCPMHFRGQTPRDRLTDRQTRAMDHDRSGSATRRRGNSVSLFGICILDPLPKETSADIMTSITRPPLKKCDSIDPNTWGLFVLLTAMR